MISFTELPTSTFVRNGDPTSAGRSAPLVQKKTNIAQFPAERAAANDGTSDLRVHDLYRNGLLFTAYNFEARTTDALRSFRVDKNNERLIDWNPLGSISNYGGSTRFDQDAVANILLPRSQSDVDNIAHKFNDTGESLISRGGGTIGGVLSNVASTAVFGAIESITQGAMADHGEQIYNSARSMYAGPENRTKVFTWNLTPRNVYDLIEIMKIYNMFSYYSYGEVGKSKYAKDMKKEIDDGYKSILAKATPEGTSLDNTVMESVTEFLTNVITVSNPTIWTVRNFGRTSEFDGKTDVFGPCQIQNIRFDKTSNGQFNGLAVAPNMPSSFVLEITMREILTLNRNTLYSEGGF
ncbi:baseplate tail tube cap [Serratia phage 92A1]|nr:baseplate tail tube cap [Serratia phage 92A1]